MNKKHRATKHIETELVQSLHFFDKETGGIIPRIDFSTTFVRDKNYQPSGDFIYAREGNATTAEAEKILKVLDKSEDTLLFSSGMSGLIAIMEVLESGDHIIVQDPIYYAISRYLEYICPRRGIEISRIKAEEIYDAERYIQKGRTKFLWVETPSNPHWITIDIQRVSKIISSLECKLIVDATCSPACTSNVLDLGADISFQSTTKYLNGHSDSLGGALSTKRRDKFWDRIIEARNYQGSVMSPLNSWLLIRGLKTLFIRFQKSSNNALLLAKHLAKNSAVEKVLYPGLEDHPTFVIAKKQMTNGFGGMISIKMNGGSKMAKKVVRKVKVFLPATSLGSTESLIEHRKLVEGPESNVEDNLIRLSIGIESSEDLISDLEQAINS